MLTLIVMGGGGIEPRNAKISEKCLYSHHNNTVLIKEYPCLILSWQMPEVLMKKKVGK